MRIFDAMTGTVLQDWRLELKIAFCTGADGGIEIYDTSKNCKWRFAPTRADASEIVLSQQSFQCNKSKRLFACFDGDNSVRFWFV